MHVLRFVQMEKTTVGYMLPIVATRRLLDIADAGSAETLTRFVPRRSINYIVNDTCHAIIEAWQPQLHYLPKLMRQSKHF
jgi:hypothetical protein